MTGTACVFVNPDRQIEFRMLPIEHGRLHVFCVPLYTPLNMAYARLDESLPAVVTTIDFTRRGRMFDGRPIFCAPSFDVKQAYKTHLVSAAEFKLFGERIDDTIRREVRQHVLQAFPDAIELDEWSGEVPLSEEERAEGLERVNMRKRGARLIVAVQF